LVKFTLFSSSTGSQGLDSFDIHLKILMLEKGFLRPNTNVDMIDTTTATNMIDTTERNVKIKIHVAFSSILIENDNSQCFLAEYAIFSNGNSFVLVFYSQSKGIFGRGLVGAAAQILSCVRRCE
jgi:hypothetical protein